MIYETSTGSKAGDYYLRLTGYTSDGNGGEREAGYVDFKLTLLDPCSVPTIKTVSIPDKTYTISGASQTFSFSSWSISPSTCGFSYSFTYTATLSSSAALPSQLITFSSSSRTFTVYSTNSSLANEYEIKVKGTFGLKSETVSFKLIVLAGDMSINALPQFTKTLTDVQMQAGGKYVY